MRLQQLRPSSLKTTIDKSTNRLSVTAVTDSPDETFVRRWSLVALQKHLDPPTDETLQSMEVVLRRRLVGASLDDLYTHCWSEKTSFFETWLKQDGKKEIMVEDWEEGSWIGDWDQEEYSHRRSVKYNYYRDPRIIGYKLGDPVARVQQTHYYRSNGEHQSVLSISTEVEGEPFANSFRVYIRGVATRVVVSDSSEDVLQIDFGVFVRFTKQILFAGQVRQVTNSETRKAMEMLFELVKSACNGTEEVIVDNFSEDDTEAWMQEMDTCDPLAFLSFCNPQRTGRRQTYMDDIDRVRHEIDAYLHFMTDEAVVEKKNFKKKRSFILSELRFVLDALDRILVHDMQTIGGNQDDRVWLQKTPVAFQRLERALVRNLSPRFANPSLASSNDATLDSMNVIVSKTLRGTVKAFEHTILADPDHFWEAWLVSNGMSNVKVDNWRKNKSPYIDVWNKESYDQGRQVSYLYDNESDLDESSDRHDNALIEVFQMHYFRKENDDKLIFSIRSKFKGPWYSDTFRVQIRWVVTQEEDEKIQIKIGTFVEIVKDTAISDKIISEMTKIFHEVQLDLLVKIKTTLIHATHTDSVASCEASCEAYEQKGMKLFPNKLLRNWLKICVPCSEASRHHDLSHGVLAASDEEFSNSWIKVRQKIRAITLVLEDREPGEQSERMNFYYSQLLVVRETLDNIVSGL